MRLESKLACTDWQLLDLKTSAPSDTHHTHIRLHTHTYLTFKLLLVMCSEADSVHSLLFL